MKIDLHLHSTASDGLLEPSMAIARAAARGATLVSLTDHDTFDGLSQARESARELGVEWITGVEFSVWAAGEPVHLLAYGFDEGHPGLASYAALFRDDRVRRANASLAALERLGIFIDRDTLARDVDRGVVTRPHLAAAIVRSGAAASREEAFERFIGDGRPCHVPMPVREAAEAIALVREAGGITSLAHPGDWTAHRTLQALVGAGMDALEAWHPSHDGRLVAYYLDLAARWGLAVTAGSDDHGWGTTGYDSTVGIEMPEPHLRLLRERLRLARRRVGRSE